MSAGVTLLYGLKETTEDIVIKIKQDYFNELKTRFEFKNHPSIRICGKDK